MGTRAASPCRGMWRVPRAPALGRDGRPGKRGFHVPQDGDPSVTCSPQVPLHCLSRMLSPDLWSMGDAGGLGSPPFRLGRDLGSPTQAAARGFRDARHKGWCSASCPALPLPTSPSPQQIPGAFIGKPGASAAQRGDGWGGGGGGVQMRSSLPLFPPLLLRCSWHLWSGMF